ncbi:response regulator [Thalassotalea piscium]|uniref:diguanylate cyclase n=1 Tax=Thalassotalea piscium TaxID=1230533 RepID=A0A7X0NFN1_9GAMM|nr:response regulator [Thalassotalea piscium]MBB6542569.1 diguanylate cyclase (GGDEF)-like protein [Thalassotalea piscium]
MAEKLLVVEDSKAIARVIQKIGESLNYEVTVAGSMAELKDILEDNVDFFVATIDYSLPDAPNGEAIEYVLSHHIPGVVMTGVMDDVTRQKILAQPVIDYIPKENGQAYMYLKRILYWQRKNNKISVLVVDDSRSARLHIADLLKRRNFTVHIAENGIEALEVLEKHPSIKMVVTDLEMPEMDGIELTNEIRRRFNRDLLAIIGVSGAEYGSNTARFIKNGADDFLRKPFCPEEFYCRITQNIENLANIEQIQKVAFTDYLTELPNRRAFFQQAEGCITRYRSKQAEFCLVMMDIDFFKKVNDTYGHNAGDHVLKMLALYLRKHFGTGLIARLGGEEFAVLIEGQSKQQLCAKLNDFRKEISEKTITYEKDAINFTISIGVVFNSTELLAKQMSLADEALYFAKENGRNQIKVADTL